MERELVAYLSNPFFGLGAHHVPLQSCFWIGEGLRERVLLHSPKGRVNEDRERLKLMPFTNPVTVLRLAIHAR